MVETTVRIASPVTKTYPVTGTTGEELLAALRDRGKAGSFRGGLDISVAPSEDAIEVVRITADPVIFVPAWKGASKADDKLKKGWQKTVDLIGKHEQDHFRDFRRSIQDLVKAIKKSETLDGKKLHSIIIDFKLDQYYKKNKLHDRRLEMDWKKMERFLTGK